MSRSATVWTQLPSCPTGRAADTVGGGWGWGWGDAGSARDFNIQGTFNEKTDTAENKIACSFSS